MSLTQEMQLSSGNYLPPSYFKGNLFRHNKAAAYMHWNICQETSKRCEHKPQTVVENNHHPQGSKQDICANRPNIIIKTCFLIDVPSIPSVKVSKKLAKDLETETVPVKIRAMEFDKNKLLKPNTKQQQSDGTTKNNQKLITLLGRAHILRKVLSFKA